MTSAKPFTLAEAEGVIERAAWIVEVVSYQKAAIWPLINAIANAGFNRGWHEKSTDDEAIQSADAALDAPRHRDTCGDGSTNRAERRRICKTAAPRATHRGDGAAHCMRPDHGDRVDQEPTSYLL